jgi:hypothetical protein
MYMYLLLDSPCLKISQTRADSYAYSFDLCVLQLAYLYLQGNPISQPSEAVTLILE